MNAMLAANNLWVLMIVGGSVGDGDALLINSDSGCAADADDAVDACNNDVAYFYQRYT